MKKYVFLIAVGLVLLFSQRLLAQDPNMPSKQNTIIAPDSSKISYELSEHAVIVNPSRKKNPKIASWLSTFVPGAGQVYNGKAWKVPIIYGAFATTAYLTMEYNSRYQQYKDIYIELSDESNGAADENELERAKEGMKYYTRYRDINIIFTLLFYLLNIIDASVDAHLSNFDVNDNLAHSWQPAIINTREQFAVGFKYTIRF